MSDVEQRILQELVYQRVRASVNLCQLVVIEEDLECSIERATRAACGSGQIPERDLARRYVAEAWRRVEREWHRLRNDLDDALDDVFDDALDDVEGETVPARASGDEAEA